MFILYICFEHWPTVILDVRSTRFKSQMSANFYSQGHEPLAQGIKDSISVHKTIHVPI